MGAALAGACGEVDDPSDVEMNDVEVGDEMDGGGAGEDSPLELGEEAGGDGDDGESDAAGDDGNAGDAGNVDDVNVDVPVELDLSLPDAADVADLGNVADVALDSGGPPDLDGIEMGLGAEDVGTGGDGAADGIPAEEPIDEVADEDGVGACAFPDPRDTADESGGDESLDLRCVTTGLTSAGEPWVRVEFEGSWRPSQRLFAWYGEVDLHYAPDISAGAFYGGVYDSWQAGQASTQAYNMLTPEQVVCLAIEETGFTVVFEPSLADMHLVVWSAVELEQASSPVFDTIVASFLGDVVDPNINFDFCEPIPSP